MAELAYETSKLWRRTLGLANADQTEHRERLKVAYRAFRENAAVLLQENARYTPNFTVHDVTHSDALWRMADHVCGENIPVNPAEAFVLGGAFLLHDAAMGLAAYEGDARNCVTPEEWGDLVYREHVRQFGEPPTAEQLANPAVKVSEHCAENVIRKYHAASAEKLIELEFDTGLGGRRLLPEDDLRDAYGRLIGSIAASHGTAVDGLLGLKSRRNLVPGFPADWAIDAVKLGCILRLADAIHLDKSRAPALLRALRAPDGQSASHWDFLARVNQPSRHEDRIQYDASMPFAPDDARLWWFALDYLRGVDAELRQVDAFLADNAMERMPVRGVAYVDTPARFARQFDVDGWKPIDATIKVSNVPKLVSDLGGRQLYGDRPEIAVRELIQNAQAALEARRRDESGFVGSRLDVRLLRDGPAWWLEVQDNGIGMDESVIIDELLDFGESGWRSAHASERIPGLVSGGFEPTGRFGIGFYSVFMLGDKVEVTTRSIESGRDEGLRLKFDGLEHRALLAPLSKRSPAGTTIRVALSKDPHSRGGILWNRGQRNLAGLVRNLCLDSPIDIWVSEPDGSSVIPSFDLASAGAGEVFDRLYPPPDLSGEEGWMEQREEDAGMRERLRNLFVSRSTDIPGKNGRRAGLMAMRDEGIGEWDFNHVSVGGGFRTGGTTVGRVEITGYVTGTLRRAARDEIEPIVDESELLSWINSQVHVMRGAGEFSLPIQLTLANYLLDSNGVLDSDHAVAQVNGGVLRYGEVRDWVADRSEVFVTNSFPSYPSPGSYGFGRWANLELPSSWVGLEYDHQIPAFRSIMEVSRVGREDRPEFVQGNVWESVWNWFSPAVHRYLIGSICEAWACGLEELLQPVVGRQRMDRERVEGSFEQNFSGVWLRCPGLGVRM